MTIEGSIWKYAFWGSGIQSINFPSSVVQVMDRAFYGCSSLRKVYVDDLAAFLKINFDHNDGTTPFRGSQHNRSDYTGASLYVKNGTDYELVEDLVIPAGVTEIQISMFRGCGSLKSVTLANDVTTIDYEAFALCPNLTSVTFGKNVKYIAQYAFTKNGFPSGVTPKYITSVGIEDLAAWCSVKFYDYLSHPTTQSLDNVALYTKNGEDYELVTDLVIPDGVTSIGDITFYGFDELKSITIPDSVTSIGDNAFSYCSAVTSLTIPDSVTSIGDEAFCGCESLPSLTIPNSVTSIGNEAFYLCTSMTSVAILHNVTSIGDGAFSACTSMRYISVSTDNTAYSSKDGVLFNKAQTELLAYPAGKSGGYTIPDGVTSISSSAFAYCEALASLIIPDSVTSIGYKAFYRCSALTRVAIGSGVEKIDSYSFSQCTALTDIYYNGSEEEWNAIENVSDSGLASSVTIHYNSTMPTCEHSWDAGTVTTAPTCARPGVKTYTCTLCKETKTEVVPAEHSWDAGTVTTAPTCTEEGVKTYTCTVCEETKTEAVDALGHSWDAGMVTDDPNCIYSGVRTYSCSRCDETKNESIPATGVHTWDSGAETKAATCTESGVETYTCIICRETKTEPIPATGHQHSAVTVTKAATCTEPGVMTYTCIYCGDTVTEAIPATGHSWDEGTVTKAAACTESGVMTYTCTNGCGATKTETIPATGHRWNEVTVTEQTCTEQGYTTRTCVCGYSYVDSYTAALGHDYENGICIRCGAEDPDYKPVDPTPSETPFTDLRDDAFYSDAVTWAVNHQPQITKGTTDTTFSPDEACTRAQVVTFIWRALGEPKATITGTQFTDVNPNAFYYKALLWASENGVVNGTSDTTFSPDDTVTRGQFVTFLWRAAQKPASSGANPFTDLREGAFYVDAVLWAAENGITSGATKTTFAPEEPCTRGQVVTFLYRYADGK